MFLLTLVALCLAKNVVIMVGDGMSLTMIEAASYLDNGANSKSPYMRMEHKTPAKTYNALNQLTDSAAAATSMGTGVRTRNGYLGLDEDENTLKNISEWYKELGGRVGAVVKAPVTHATPGGFMAHSNDRYSNKPIADSLYELKPDLLFGGGRAEDNFGPTADRLATEGYNYIKTKRELLSDRNTCGRLPLLGIFADDNLDFYADWDPAGEEVPGLVEMTAAAIDILDSCGQDYFLLVEGSLVDIANHQNNSTRAVLDAAEFNDTIDYVMNRYASRTDTLVLVTGDHESGGLSILSVEDVSGPLPSEVTDPVEKRRRRLGRMQGLGQGLNYSTTAHSATPVIVGAIGSHSAEVEFISHISDLFNIMKKVAEEPYTVVGEERETLLRSYSVTPEDQTCETASSVPLFVPFIIGFAISAVLSLVLYFGITSLVHRKTRAQLVPPSLQLGLDEE